MTNTAKPTTKPERPFYSAGPCCKHPGWSLEGLEKHFLAGRSHRATVAKNQLIEAAERQRKLLGIPADYKIGIVGGSDTGAFEAALWSMIGARPVDVYSWEVFSNVWTEDLTKRLQPGVPVDAAVGDYGIRPDLTTANPAHDVVFTWNGTTAGVRITDTDWIASNREGLTFCDATSAVYCLAIDWHKLDVVSWSWQKGLGGEAQHGMLALSPRAIERLNTYRPPVERQVPKLYTLAKKDGYDTELFEKGMPVNTPSMMCVADLLSGIEWAESIGGLPALLSRVAANEKAVLEWMGKTSWAGFLAKDPATRTTHTHCIMITDPRYLKLDDAGQRNFIKQVSAVMDTEGAGYDVGGHRKAPPMFRLTTGPTLDAGDVKLTLQWLDWAVTDALGKLPA